MISDSPILRIILIQTNLSRCILSSNNLSDREKLTGLSEWGIGAGIRRAGLAFNFVFYYHEVAINIRGS
jgi:hypothetical protein